MTQDKVQEFLDYLLVEKGYSNNTIVAYRNDLTQMVRWLSKHQRTEGRPNWHKVDTDTVRQYMAFLASDEKGYASSTRARKNAAVKSFFHYLFQTGHLSDDPTATIDSPKVRKRPPRARSRDEIDTLLAAPKGESAKAIRDRALLQTLYATGMRVTELISLDKENVDLSRNLVRTLGKGAKDRQLFLHHDAVDALRTYLDEGRPALARDEEETALFLNPRGQRLTRQGLWLIVKQYVEEAGLVDTKENPFSPHTLRHSFATHMLSSGRMNLREVQTLLGHESLATTQVYTKIPSDRLRQVYNEAHPRAKSEDD